MFYKKSKKIPLEPCFSPGSVGSQPEQISSMFASSVVCERFVLGSVVHDFHSSLANVLLRKGTLFDSL